MTYLISGVILDENSTVYERAEDAPFSHADLRTLLTVTQSGAEKKKQAAKCSKSLSRVTALHSQELLQTFLPIPCNARPIRGCREAGGYVLDNIGLCRGHWLLCGGRAYF